MIDTQPTAIVSDAVHLFHRIDGTLVIVRLAQSRRDHTRRYFEQLLLLDAPVLGMVVNCVRPNHGYYGYGYQSNYGGPETPVGFTNAYGQRELAGERLTVVNRAKP